MTELDFDKLEAFLIATTRRFLDYLEEDPSIKRISTPYRSQKKKREGEKLQEKI
ncbi:MAG: hypothetical protein QXS37_05010 [Candidatus Aenigmatarchaeota archaeon]